HLRGPGEFLGDTQTGMPDLTLKALQNPDLLKIAEGKARGLLDQSPTLEMYPLLSKRLNQFREEVHLE
ncbi:MAG: hypothetical protein NUV96_02550, partial [Candidatus Colwellbacteria bacterium]|nr:hypothetical protein [Candidatus Colwellbacteria bacterium]